LKDKVAKNPGSGPLQKDMPADKSPHFDQSMALVQ
jgi:hypothetical protein